MTEASELAIAHEGVIVSPREHQEDLPYASAAEAERAIDEGLTAIRDGMVSASRGQELLDEARRRKAWELLGYQTWQECLQHHSQAVFRTIIATDARVELAARLRKGNATTRQIAEALGTAPSTASRDVAKARETGLLDNEPARVEGRDGRVRDTKQTGTSASRRDLAKTFRAAAEIIDLKAATLARCLEDDRWDGHREVIAPYRHDLRRAYETLGLIIADLDDVEL